jgi:hypothetical protein
MLDPNALIETLLIVLRADGVPGVPMSPGLRAAQGQLDRMFQSGELPTDPALALLKFRSLRERVAVSA